MTTELIVAPPAAGKTSACIQRIQALRARQPLAHIRVVVPDRLQAAAFRQKLADSGGALGTYVGTFGDIYRSILEQSGVDVPVASSPLLHRLVQETVDEAVQRGQLIHFAPLQPLPGFILALRESFADLKRSLVYPERFQEFALTGTPAQQDLALLYSRYQNRLRELNWADPEGISWLAVEAMEHLKSVASSIQLLIVDGFDSFNGAQYQALSILSRQVGDVLITFPGKIGSRRAAHRRFEQDIERLISKLAPRIVPLEAQPHLPPALSFIESQLFEGPDLPWQTPPAPILLEVRSPAEEAREALRWIKGLVVRENIPLSSCMLFTPNPDVYQPLLRACAAEFGIPIRFTQAEPLESSPAISALVNLLSLPVRNFNTHYLVNVLRSPYFELSMTPETVDKLESISRVAQIVEGRPQWQETWGRLAPASDLQPSELDDERRLPGLPRGAEAAELRRGLDAFFDSLTPPNTRSTQTEWITWLEDLLERLQFYAKTGGERDEAACEALRETLRALVLSEEILGERRVDYPQFLADLQGTLEGVGLQEPVPLGKPVLLVGRMVEARGIRVQAAALLGFSEGLFPAVEHPDPFLDEELRAALGLDQRLQREQAGLFYQAVTRADRHLLITRPYLSDDGEKWEESPFWIAVKRLLQESALQTVRPDDLRPLSEAASSQELLFSAVRRGSLPKQFEMLTGRWLALRHAREVLRARRAKTPGGPFEGFVAPAAPALNQRYSPAQVWSASRLENYGGCPFQFYVATALGLEGRAQPKLGLDPSQLGSILHKILERAYREAANPADVDAVLESLQTSTDAVFSTAPKVYGFRPSALWNYEKEQLLQKLQDTIRALAEDSGWTPFAYELGFGIGGTPPLVIDLGAETLLIRGVIDRVDRNASGQLRVIDYKTGSSHLSQNDLKDGRRLQLPIYALAVRDALKLGNPVDGMYWKILGAEAGPLKLAKFKTETGQGLQAAVEVVSGHLLRIVKGIRAAEFPPLVPHGGCPAYCPAAQWCWRFEGEW